MDIWIPVLVAVVTGGFSLIGAIIAGKRQTESLQTQLAKNQAVFEAVVTEKIGVLTKQVEEVTEGVIPGKVLSATLSIGVAVFIFLHAIGNLKESLNLFLEKKNHI